MLSFWILNCLLKHEFLTAFCPHKHTSMQRIPAKLSLLYQHRTGHLARQTPMNNSATERSDRWEEGGKGGGNFKGEEALGQEEEKHREGIATIKPAESIVRENPCVSVCVPGDTRAPLCCPVQMPVHQHRAAVPDSAASSSLICPEESSQMLFTAEAIDQMRSARAKRN